MGSTHRASPSRSPSGVIVNGTFPVPWLVPASVWIVASLAQLNYVSLPFVSVIIIIIIIIIIVVVVVVVVVSR
jgi:hypothetical protein